ncbi:MAG: peptidase S8 [Candidatus Eremiobacteraeota bacterium]|nr:peptidase S8 [Candidatus Eremiobacteraeota bacterium]
MNGPFKLVAPLVVALGIAACSGGSDSNSLPAMTGVSSNPTMRILPAAKSLEGVQVCPNLGPRYGACMSRYVGDSIMPAIAGHVPADYQSAYNLPSATKGAGQIVAIVDAYDNPNVSSDLATYRNQFSLGTANFTKYNQNGQQSNYPTPNQNWGLEEDLDVQTVSAVCPKCTIYLVEANSNNTSDLETAEKTAVTLGAHIVSNSWGCLGSNNCVDPSYFDTPGVEYLASAGDSGYGTQAPAALASIVSVGGTVLQKSGSQWTEMAWNGTGSGCATGITKPSWQHDSGCSYRTMNDVSAVAYFAAEYDSYKYNGWIVVNGTSISSPLLGGVFGLAGNASSQNAGSKFWTQSRRKRKHDLHDITTGKNGTCSPSYLCTAGKGYDGPTGWGTPNGVKAF